MLHLLGLLALSVPPEPGHVRLPVSTWTAIQRELAQADAPSPPSGPVAALERSLRGRFDRGLLRATLSVRFEILADGHVRVPIVDGAASLGAVELDGRRTSLLLEGGMYTVGVEGRGLHALTAELFVGKEQDRFARRVAFALPGEGPTAIDLSLPERDVDVSLLGGSVRAVPQGGATRVLGSGGARGRIDLAWRRRLGHGSPVALKAEGEVFALVALKDSVVDGTALVKVRVLEGETDRVDLQIPAALEVRSIEGDAVLQWRTEADGRLAVLLRYLVDRELELRVRFTAPFDPSRATAIEVPTLAAPTRFSGALGVEAMPGLEVTVVGSRGAEALGSRDVPRELAELSSAPLVSAFRFEEAPEIELAVARQAELELGATVASELQASSVFLEGGLEITKLKLRVRNDTRQHLGVRLPPGALLTHALVDGEPVRPARDDGAASEGGDALLFPLRQSERGDAARTHEVRPGETLSDVANFYFSDPSAWQAIIDENPGELGGGVELSAGQRLRIPARGGAGDGASSFVVELAYKREGGRLGAFGRARAELPRLDVEVLAATWHVYLPTAIEPLLFDANLTQLSRLRYDPYRRARDFLDLALGVRDAWAGGSEYQNILSMRKVIWKSEAEEAASGDAVLAAFPLVGERYRFKRLLLGRERPSLELIYVARSLEAGVRRAALFVGAALAWLFFARVRRREELAVGALGLGLALLVAYFVLGTHRRLLWGFDLGLLAVVLRPRLAAWAAALAALAREPWRLASLVRPGVLGGLVLATLIALLVLAFPLLLSSLAFLGLATLAWLEKEAARA